MIVRLSGGHIFKKPFLVFKHVASILQRSRGRQLKLS